MTLATTPYIDYFNNDTYVDFMNGIGTYLNTLKYLKISIMYSVNNWPSQLCNLHTNLQYLHLYRHALKDINDCIGNFNNLRYFYANVGLNSLKYFPSSIFNLPKIKIIAFDANQITWSTLVKVFYNTSESSLLNSSLNSSLEISGYSDSITHLYFQHNDFCNDEALLANESHKELVDMINEFDSCFTMFGNDGVFCSADNVANGVCDEECSTGFDVHDGGDCFQTCDFQMCDIIGWNDDICNQTCNSSLCNWDGYDCADFSCFSGSLCVKSMLHDGICNPVCLQDNTTYCSAIELSTDCSGNCHDAYECYSMAELFQLMSLMVGSDEVVDQYELCLIQAWLSPYITIPLNCSDIMYNPKFDLNLNGILGFYESILMVNYFVYGNNSDIPLTLLTADCSMCLEDPSLYYA